MSSKSQCERLLSHFKRGGKITSYSAMELLGIASLHRRLSDLRLMGYEIISQWHEVKNRYGDTVMIKVYQLAKRQLKNA